MGSETGIAWTDHTFNPWTGCLRVSPGCDNCYAAVLAKRNTKTFGSWEPGAERKRTSPANWREPRKWNRAAAEAGVRRRVFCASMADVFDNQASSIWREDLFELIRETPSLDWQLLTKRPQNIARMLPPDWDDGYRNVWLGTTAENQTEADRRIPHLLAVPAVVRFLSCEPLLGPVDLTSVCLHDGPNDPGMVHVAGIKHIRLFVNALRGSKRLKWSGLDWVIIGGESGRGARPMHREWVDDIMDQCRAAQVPFFMKQIGSAWQPDQGWGGDITGKGDNPAEWPLDLRVQQFPNALRRAGADVDGKG